jgi:hypothetical protein
MVTIAHQRASAGRNVGVGGMALKLKNKHAAKAHDDERRKVRHKRRKLAAILDDVVDQFLLLFAPQQASDSRETTHSSQPE